MRKKLEELAAVTKDLDGNLKMLSKAANIIAAEQLKKRVTELTEAQNQKMTDLVALSPDPQDLKKFNQLSRDVDDLGAQIKAAASAGAEFVVIVGKDELDSDKLTLREMARGEQESLSLAEIEKRLKTHFQG